jgi:ribosomal protein L7/L12
MYTTAIAHTYEALKAEISQFLHVDNEEMMTSGVLNETSIQSLLRQGRKVDAIELVRASQHIGLAEAVNVVNGIDQKMNAPK